MSMPAASRSKRQTLVRENTRDSPRESSSRVGMVCVLCFFSREYKANNPQKNGQFHLAYTFNLGRERDPHACAGSL